MTSAFSWPPDGQLQVRFLRLSGKQTTPQEWRHRFLLRCRQLFSDCFLLLGAALEQDIVLLIQPKKNEDPIFLNTAAYFYSQLACKEFAPDIAFAHLSEPYEQYAELYRAYQEQPAQKQETPSARFDLRRPDCSALCLPKERKKIRQKWIQRLSERNAAYVVSMLQRATERQDAFWPGVLLFLDALEAFDTHLPLEDFFTLFRRPEPYATLDLRLKKCFSSISAPATSESHHGAIVEKAMELLRTRFSDPNLSEIDVAEEFGFSQAHFSRIFKKITGKSFVTALTELRIRQAKALLTAKKQTVAEIAWQCGYQNQRYFLSVFKKKVGCTPTQFCLTISGRTGEE